MIRTLSMCPVCYRKIPAEIKMHNSAAWMFKECPEHGKFSAMVEKDAQHFSNFYRPGTLGNNNTIIIHAHNQCNMKCSWCYYPMGQEQMHDADYYNTLLHQYRGFNLLLSGGEPTERPDYFEFVDGLKKRGWPVSSITNMINLGNKEFFNRTMNDSFIQGRTYKFAMSMQHRDNYSKEIFMQKIAAIENIEDAGLKASCMMFSIQSLDELEWIRQFYDSTKHTFEMIRIRCMFKNWNNKGDASTLSLSDLHKAFIDRFADLEPTQDNSFEHSNLYCLYMQMNGGMKVSLSCAPTVENIDYHQCSRPVYMLAMDGRCYPVPITQIVNEGIALGWKDGFRLQSPEV